jgi:hypothetical protein
VLGLLWSSSVSNRAELSIIKALKGPRLAQEGDDLDATNTTFSNSVSHTK